MSNKRNIEYALYDGNDIYITGFSSIREMSAYLGKNKPTLSNIISRYPERRGEVFKVLIQDKNIYDCSQKIFTYHKKIVSRDGENLGAECSIYQFWEEDLSKI